MKHPWDWLAHFTLCLVVTAVFGWKIGVTVGLTIEATQIEDAYFSKTGVNVADTLIDLFADGLGIIIGEKIHQII